MIARIKNLRLFVIVVVFFPGELLAQELRFERDVSAEEIETRRRKVESNPADPTTNQAYINAMYGARREEDLIRQYEVWIKKYPKYKNLPFIIGDALTHMESPKARPFLLKAAKLDPDNGVIYKDLSLDADRWGDKKASREYMRKAAAADPENADYAFSNAMGKLLPDGSRDTNAIKDVIDRFPNAVDKIANMLFYTGYRSKDPREKEQAFKTVIDKYPNSIYAPMTMSAYFEFLVDDDPERAIAFATEMESKGGQWAASKERAKLVYDASQLAAVRKYDEAITLLEKISTSRMSSGKHNLIIADYYDQSGRPHAAYDKIMGVFTSKPSTIMMEFLLKYGKKIGKDEVAVRRDLYQKMDAKAKPATDFSLKNYFTNQNTSLADFKGKVVLVTYWFPGCGPCRGEFPHLEYVLKDFKGKPLNYLGINVASDQNEYVLPFVKQSGVSFTPLEDVKDRQKGTLDNRNAAPSNFIIGKDGLLYFSGFKIDETNREDFRLMLDLVINKG
ncbi:MAG: redoxin domain-containing protein [Chitinophagaceae bacterium]